MMAFVLGLLASCKDTVRASPEPAASSPSSRAGAGAVVPSSAVVRELAPAEQEALRRVDGRVVLALRKGDKAAVRAVGTATLDVDATLHEVSPSECVGDVMAVEREGTGMVVRHILGFEPSADGKCMGAHELHLHFQEIAGEPRLTSVNRWGW